MIRFSRDTGSLDLMRQPNVDHNGHTFIFSLKGDIKTTTFNKQVAAFYAFSFYSANTRTGAESILLGG